MTTFLEINPLALGSCGSTASNETGASVYKIRSLILCVLSCLRFTHPLFQMLVFKIWCVGDKNYFPFYYEINNIISFIFQLTNKIAHISALQGDILKYVYAIK